MNSLICSTEKRILNSFEPCSMHNANISVCGCCCPGVIANPSGANIAADIESDAPGSLDF